MLTSGVVIWTFEKVTCSDYVNSFLIYKKLHAIICSNILSGFLFECCLKTLWSWKLSCDTDHIFRQKLRHESHQMLTPTDSWSRCDHSHQKPTSLRVRLSRNERLISLKTHFLVSSLLGWFPCISPCIPDGREYDTNKRLKWGKQGCN